MRSFPIWVLIALLAAGCAAPIRDQEPAPAPVPDAAPVPVPDQPGTLNSPAVLELSGEAREALSSGRFDDAAQFLERAIRIEPQNGELWHELARVRFEQGNYEQARQLAARSNALITTGSRLKTRNDDLIEASRSALGY